MTPLIDGQVLAAAGIFAAAALVLPVLVRGRTPLIDALGALIWAAGLITTLRLVAGGASPPGLLFGALLAGGGCGPPQPQGARRASDPSGISRGGWRPASDWETGRAPARFASGLRPTLRSRAAWPPLAFRRRRRRPTHPS